MNGSSRKRHVSIFSRRIFRVAFIASFLVVLLMLVGAVAAQDPVGGGWRYHAQQPGDTSVVGWQLMALKSGRMAYLHVDQSVFLGASKFLDSVQTDGGSGYGYKDPGNKPSTTAIGPNPIPTVRPELVSIVTGEKRMWPTISPLISATSESRSGLSALTRSTMSASSASPKASSLISRITPMSPGPSGRIETAFGLASGTSPVARWAEFCLVIVRRISDVA